MGQSALKAQARRGHTKVKLANETLKRKNDVSMLLLNKSENDKINLYSISSSFTKHCIVQRYINALPNIIMREYGGTPLNRTPEMSLGFRGLL